MNKDNYCKNIAEVKGQIADMIMAINANNNDFKEVLECIYEKNKQLEKDLNILTYISIVLVLNIIILYFKY